MFGETKEHLFELIFMFVFMIQIRLKENHHMRINIYKKCLSCLNMFNCLKEKKIYFFFTRWVGRGRGGLIGGIRPSMAVIFMLLWKKVVCLSSTLNILK